MTPHRQDDIEQPEISEIAAELQRLAERIDGCRYPGLAWKAARRRHATRWVLYPAAAAAVAAIVTLTVTHRPAAPPPTPAPPLPVAQAAAVVRPIVGWYVPADIDLAAGASEVRMETLSVPMPSNADLPTPGRFEWSIPSVPLFKLE